MNVLIRLLRAVIMITAIISSPAVFSQTTVVMWNFDDQNITADAGIPANLSKLAQNTSTGPYTFPIGIGGTGFACSSNGWDGYYNYWLIDFVTTGYYSLTVSSIQRSSATGPRDFKIQYGFSSSGPWTDLPGATLITLADNYTSGVVSNVPLPAVCDNQPAVYLRWIMLNGVSVAGGTVGSAGTSRMENLIITGNPPAPVNDNCPGIPLGINASCTPVSGTTVSATQSLSAYPGDDDDVWYNFIPSGTTATLEITGSTNFDPVLELRDTAACNSTSIMINDFTLSGGTERMRVSGLIPGKAYKLRVFSSATGAAAQGNFNACAYQYTPGSNDDASTTVPMLGIGSNTGMDNTFYGFHIAEPTGTTWLNNFDAPSNSQWFRFVPASTDCYSVAAGGFDTQLSVYTASDANDYSTFTEVASDDNTGPGNTGLITSVSLNAGVTYYVQVNGYKGAVGTPVITIGSLGVSEPGFVAATSPGCSKFTANWGGMPNAAGFYLDVSDDNFNTFIPGFHNRDVSYVTAFTVTGLNPGTTYQFRVRAYGQCGYTQLSGYSDTAQVITSPEPGTPVFTSGATALCVGQGSTYTATAVNAATITYSIVAGSEMIHPTTGVVTNVSANFTVRATATDSCGTSTADVVVTVTTPPPTPVISLNGGVLSSSAATGNQWYDLSGPVSGATGQYFTPAVNGYYYTVVNLSGCASLPSDTLYVLVTGIELNHRTEQLSIYPNPGKGIFTIGLAGNEMERGHLVVCNEIGQVVYTAAVKGSGQRNEIIDLTGFPDGLYSIRIICENGVYVSRLLIQ